MSDESATERDTIEQLAEAYVARFRAGERSSIEEFVGRYPDQAEELRELLPALVLLEQNASLDDTAAFGGKVSREPVPTEIGDFTIVREIARGGMGIVYEAIQQSLGRHVALKVLATPGLLNPAHLDRFRLEARAAARLHHTHIVPVFDVGEHNGLHYYAMQFIQGQSLDLVINALRKLRRADRNHDKDQPAGDEFTRSVATGMLSGEFRATERDVASAAAVPTNNGHEPNPVASLSGSQSSEFTTSHGGREFYRSVARVGLQVSEALSYAHSEGILHRDIKPSNLLLDARGNVWVTDFGLAKTEGTEGLTHTGDFVGTLRYMPPERLEGWSDRRSDLYSLGATLYELITLRPFLESDSRGQLVDMILHATPAAPSKFDPHIPRDLETIILKAIGKEPAARYRSADEMAEDLRLYLADRPVLARRSTPAEQLVRWCRRNPAVAALLLVVATTLVIGTVVSSYFAASASREAADAVTARDEAEHQRHRAELVNQFFMDEVFGQADPNVFKRAGISLVQALDTAAGNIDTKFPDDPELRRHAADATRSNLLRDGRTAESHQTTPVRGRAVGTRGRQARSENTVGPQRFRECHVQICAAHGSESPPRVNAGRSNQSPRSRPLGYIAYRDPLRLLLDGIERSEGYRANRKNLPSSTCRPGAGGSNDTGGRVFVLLGPALARS